MEEINFKKHTGKETAVTVINEEKVGGGAVGDIYDSVIKIGEHEKHFIVKKFKPNSPMRFLFGANAQRALKNYKEAKEGGLRVFPTFRLSEDKTSILMTSAIKDNQIVASTNNLNKIKKLLEGKKIETIENFSEFLETYIEQCVKAAAMRIRFAGDEPFFFITKTNPTKIDFVLGDIDMLGTVAPFSKIQLLQRNLDVFATILISFLGKLGLSNFEEIKVIIHNRMEDVLKKASMWLHE